MDYRAYSEFCRLAGFNVIETTNGVWIGPSHGFFNRMPLYEMTPPSEDELRCLLRRYSTLGVHYAAHPGKEGRVSHNYFVRDQNYDLNTLNAKGRWSVRKGLAKCKVRPMYFDELERLGLPLNLDTLARQGRNDPLFTNKNQWACLCQAGQKVAGAEAWGAFVGNELGAYIILFRTGLVVNLLYSHISTKLLDSHPSSALFFTVIQTMMRTPGVDAVYNGPEWLTSDRGLDRFKQRLGFEREAVVFVVRLRPLARRVLLNKGVRRMISGLGRWMSDNDFYQQVQGVLDMAALSIQR